MTAQGVAVELGTAVTEHLHALEVGHFTSHVQRGLPVRPAVDGSIVVQQYRQGFHMAEQDREVQAGCPGRLQLITGQPIAWKENERKLLTFGPMSLSVVWRF